MRKLLSVLLSIMLILSIVGCGSSDKQEASQNKDSGIEVDKGLLTVDITLPASFFENGLMDSDLDTEVYAKEEGYNSVRMNDDGSMTITMTKAKHKEIINEMEAGLNETFDEMINDPDVTYIESIEPNKDYTEFTVTVDRAGFDSAFWDFTPLVIGFQAMFYQAFAGTDLDVTINMKYSDTGEIFSVSTYPETLENSNEIE